MRNSFVTGVVAVLVAIATRDAIAAPGEPDTGAPVPQTVPETAPEPTPAEPPAQPVIPMPSNMPRPAEIASPAVPASTRNDEVVWRPRWRRFQTGEYILTGALIAGTAAFILFGKEGRSNWTGPILFDEPVRKALRGGTVDGRRAAQTVGDAAYYGGLAYPFVVDALAVTLIGHQKPDVAAQMTLIDAEAFAITGFLSFLSNATIRRQRPYARDCAAGNPPGGFPSCAGGGQTESFFSGHTGIAYTGAALTCSHHARLPLYGKSPVAGAVTCVTMLTAATVGGTARIVADKHYLTDVLVGAGVGLASGFLVPWFHYHESSSTPPSTANAKPLGDGLRVLPVPMLSLDGGGVGALGIF